MDLEIVCFSYNRAALLRNLVVSAKSCCPCARVTIFDDCSEDAETNRIIDALEGDGVSVIRQDKKFKSSHGGLHANMRTFFEHYAKTEYVMFLQDDTQVIRSLEDSDMDCIRTFFEDFPDAGFLYPMFSRVKNSLAATPRKLSDGSGVWFRLDAHKYRGFSAICIFKPARLIDAGFCFGESEIETSELASKAFGAMAEMAMPIAAFMPAPYTARFRKDTIVHKIWGRKNTGCFPINYLDRPEVQRMRALFPYEKPLVPDFLVAPSYKAGHPWPVFRMQRASRIWRWLDRAELRVRRLW